MALISWQQLNVLIISRSTSEQGSAGRAPMYCRVIRRPRLPALTADHRAYNKALKLEKLNWLSAPQPVGGLLSLEWCEALVDGGSTP